MKTKILTLLTFLFAWQANAQTPNTIVNDNSSWATLVYGLGAYNVPCCVETQYAFFDGDSIVADVTYKKVFSYNDKAHENIKYEGLIREHEKKTYFIPANSKKEYLLYDFSLEEGDTFEYIEPHIIPESDYAMSLYVKQVDFIEINGVQLKRIQFTWSSVPDYGAVRATWIETIGSLDGLFYPGGMLAPGGKRALLCYSQNNELVYKNPTYSNCYYDNPDDIISEQTKTYLPLFGEYETSYNIFINCGIVDIEMTDSLYYTGEQIIDGKTYKTFKDYYYLRATEDNSKVYLRYQDYWGNGEWKEVLMFDLSLEKGDSFIFPNSEDSFIVQSVTIEKSGRKHILLRAKSEYSSMYLKFIEGVGSSAGFFDPSGKGVLLCSSKDGESTYFFYNDFWSVHIGDKRDCIARLFKREPVCSFKSVDVDDASLSGDWLIYPNPFSEAFYVRHETEQIEQLRVYNEAGQLILEKEINDTEAHIDLSAPPGTYYVSIITETGKQHHKKVIRQ